MSLRTILMAVAVVVATAAAGLSLAARDIDSLLREADELRSSDPRRAAELLDELADLQAAATAGQRETYEYLRAYQKVFSGRFDEAIASLVDLIARAEDVELQYRAGALLVNSYAATRQFSEGLSQLDRTLALLERIEGPELRYQGMLAGAVLYNQVGQYELGRHYAELVLADHAGASGRSLCFAGNLRLEALLHLQSLPESDDSIRALVARCLAVDEPAAAGFARTFLARKWHGAQRTDEAITLLEETLSEAEAIGYPRLTAEFRSLLGEYHLEVGNVDAAIKHARAAVAGSGGTAYSLPLVAAHRVLYEAALQQGDEERALAELQRYAEVDKAYLNDIKARELAFQLARHEALQKNQTIELLNKQNQVLQLEKQVSTQATRNTQLLAALLAVLLAFIGYWAFKTKRVQIAMRRLAESDPLTRISNRRHFTRQAEAALKRCQKAGGEVSLVMFDLDHFKYINDLYGHGTGDWVLETVAQVAGTVCRKGDDIGRLGGEEFAILLADCDLETAVGLAERCRERVACIDTTASWHAFQVTASFGVASTATAGFALDPLLAQADKALYASKREGRDRVSAYAADLEAQAAGDPQAAPVRT